MADQFFTPVDHDPFALAALSPEQQQAALSAFGRIQSMPQTTVAPIATGREVGDIAERIRNNAWQAHQGLYDAPSAGEIAMSVIGPPMARGAIRTVGGKLLQSALPMDEASRMARAAEQGYTIDAFKGLHPYDWRTEPSYVGLHNPREIPAEIPGGPQELTTINSPNAPYAGFFSNRPDVAERFANHLGATMPAKLKFDNPLVIDAKGRHAADFQFESIARRRGTMDELQKFKSAFDPESKYDGVILKNTADEGDVYVPRNPDQIRSRFAALDPANKGSGLLLGSGVLGALGVRLIPVDHDPFATQGQQP